MKTKNKIILIISASVAFILLISGARFVMNMRKQLMDMQIKFLDEKAKKEQLQVSLARKTQELQDASNELNTVKQKLNSSERNNAQLEKIKQELDAKIIALEDAKKTIEAKLHSLAELRKMMRQVKIEMHEQAVQRELLREKLQQEIDDQKLSNGNRGFVVKDSVSTYKPSIKIEVNPAP